MKQINSKLWKKCITLVLVLCLICTAFGQNMPTKAMDAKASTGPKSYTVEINEVTDLFLCNAEPSDGPVTLTYTVKSATAANVGNNGVIATTAPKTTFPYNGTGSMKFHPFENVVMKEGTTYSITMQLGTDGTVSTDDVWLPREAGASKTDSKYFGIYVNPTTTAKLTDVTCTDANGNDLGLQSNSESCVIKESGSSAGSKYTVKIKDVTNLFLCNAKPSDGPVTLSYTVKSATLANAGNNGVIATTAPESTYPYNGTGSMKFHHVENVVMKEGTTYSITMQLGADGTISTDDVWLPNPAGASTADAKYFGIYVNPTTTAELVDVTCTDAKGNDLGLQSNSEDCVITENKSDTGAKYKVKIKDVTNLFLCNAKPSDGPVTLSYTVKSATLANAGNNGVIATTAPKSTHPYNGTGSMKFHHVENVVMKEGTTYSITMQLGVDGTVSTDDVWLPNPAGASTADAKYFGIYVNPTTTAELVDVTCTDAKGNDLGLQSNDDVNCVITEVTTGDGEEPGGEEPGGEEPGGDDPVVMEPADDSKATKYTITLGEVVDMFVSNKLATNKAVTLRYTVESATAAAVGNNGVSATTDPTIRYPYTSGSMWFHPLENVVMVEGRSYTLVLALDRSGKVTFKGSYTDAENTTPVTIETTYLPNPAGTGAKASQHFGIYVNPTTTAKLTNVTCVDSDGNDLGVQVNATNVLITAGQEGEQGKAETLDPNYDMITLGNFGIKDGAYHSGITYGSYPLSMHKKVFSVDIEFSVDVGEDLRYGSQVDGWHGLRFWSDTNCLYMEDVDGNTDQYTFIPLIAGTTLVGKELNMKLSTEYVDSDGDGEKDDVKLGVWFNDKLYNNKYIYLKDYRGVLGKNLGVYSSNDVAQLKVKSVAGIETGVDYTIFGFTRNWKQELGIQ